MKVLANWNVSDVERAIIRESWPGDAEIIFPGGRDDSGDKSGRREAGTEFGVIVGGANAELLKETPGLRLVQMLGHGIDGVLKHREILRSRNITVARANPAAVNISEYVIMSMVLLSRRILAMHYALAHEGSWSPERKAGRMVGSLGGELYGSTLGLVGYGSIGREVARRAKAFGMKIGVCVRHPEKIKDDEALIDFRTPAGQIDGFLGKCGYVVISMPLTDESRGLFDAGRFAAMQKGSYLVNISRGPIVDERALYEALRDGHLGGAASDVWTVEETGGKDDYPTEYPIHQYNVLMTHHYCGATKQSRERAIQTAGENIRRLIEGRDLVNVADLTLGY